MSNEKKNKITVRKSVQHYDRFVVTCATDETCEQVTHLLSERGYTEGDGIANGTYKVSGVGPRGNIRSVVQWSYLDWFTDTPAVADGHEVIVMGDNHWSRAGTLNEAYTAWRGLVDLAAQPDNHPVVVFGIFPAGAYVAGMGSVHWKDGEHVQATCDGCRAGWVAFDLNL